MVGVVSRPELEFKSPDGGGDGKVRFGKRSSGVDSCMLRDSLIEAQLANLGVQQPMSKGSMDSVIASWDK